MTNDPIHAQTFAPLLTKSGKWRIERDERRAIGHAQAHSPKPLPTRRRTAQDKARRNVRKAYHPTREIGEFFADLSDRGKEIALRLVHKRASGMARPELLARIHDLRRYVGVKQYG